MLFRGSSHFSRGLWTTHAVSVVVQLCHCGTRRSWHIDLQRLDSLVGEHQENAGQSWSGRVKLSRRASLDRLVVAERIEAAVAEGSFHMAEDQQKSAEIARDTRPHSGFPQLCSSRLLYSQLFPSDRVRCVSMHVKSRRCATLRHPVRRLSVVDLVNEVGSLRTSQTG